MAHNEGRLIIANLDYRAIREGELKYHYIDARIVRLHYQDMEPCHSFSIFVHTLSKRFKFPEFHL
jgi:hypothetical protein